MSAARASRRGNPCSIHRRRRSTFTTRSSGQAISPGATDVSPPSASPSSPAPSGGWQTSSRHRSPASCHGKAPPISTAIFFITAAFSAQASSSVGSPPTWRITCLDARTKIIRTHSRTMCCGGSCATVWTAASSRVSRRSGTRSIYRCGRSGTGLAWDCTCAAQPRATCEPPPRIRSCASIAVRITIRSTAMTDDATNCASSIIGSRTSTMT